MDDIALMLGIQGQSSVETGSGAIVPPSQGLMVTS